MDAWFQSPHGDSFFSDAENLRDYGWEIIRFFQIVGVVLFYTFRVLLPRLYLLP